VRRVCLDRTGADGNIPSQSYGNPLTFALHTIIDVERREIDMSSHDDLVRIVLDACREKDGRQMLDCETAHDLAKKQNLQLADIGKVCNDRNIKIVNCQLGCFGE